MFRSFITVFICMSLSALGTAEIDHRIIGGVETAKNEFPWIVNLIINRTGLCGGSIIDKDWILTAAHCVHHRVPGIVVVTAGDHSRSLVDGTEQVRTGLQIIIHSNYNSINFQNDIALLKLNQSLVFGQGVSSIALPTASFVPKGPLTVAGWGRTLANQNTSNSVSDKLRKVDLNIIDLETCKKGYSNTMARLTENMICASDATKQVCNGDSGGPLMGKEKNSVVVCGISSFGIEGCGGGNTRPGVFTRTSSYFDWVRLEAFGIKPSGSSKLCDSLFLILTGYLYVSLESGVL